MVVDTFKLALPRTLLILQSTQPEMGLGGIRQDGQSNLPRSAANNYAIEFAF